MLNISMQCMLIIAAKLRVKSLIKPLLQGDTHGLIYLLLFLFLFNHYCDFVIFTTCTSFYDEVLLDEALFEKLFLFLVVVFEISSVLLINTLDEHKCQDNNNNNSSYCHHKIVCH